MTGRIKSQHMDELAETHEMIAELVEALEFYADKLTYKTPQTLAFHHFDYSKTPVLVDSGKRASSVLSRAKGETQ